MKTRLRSNVPNFVSKCLRGLSRPLGSRDFGLAFNSRMVRGGPAAVFSVATNADVPAITAETENGWLLLAPYGKTDYWHEEKNGDLKLYDQVFERPQAEKMVTAFNSVLAKKGTKFRGLSIYVGHPDVNPSRWPDDSRLGGVMALDARADGLYVQAAWNDRGETNIKQGYHVYPSPAWIYNMADKDRTGRIEPDELLSVGLVNTPRIRDVEAWTNADVQPNHDTTTIMDPEARKKLLKLLGLADNATDEQLGTAINSALAGDTPLVLSDLRSTATNAEVARQTAQTSLTTTTGELTTARGETARFREIAVNALLDSAINSGRLAAAERPAYVQQFATNFDTASVALAAKGAALPHQEVKITRGAEDDLSTRAARSVAFNALVEGFQDGGKRTYDQAVSAARADERGKKILKAMEDADKAAAEASR